MSRSSEKSSFRHAEKLLRDYRVPRGVTPAAIREFLSSLDCPRALTAWLLYESREHEQLTELVCNPDHYLHGRDFRDAYCATKFLSKANFLKLPRKRDEVALQKFLSFEELCRNTNRRFRGLEFDPLYNGPNVWLLNAMKRKISQILGDFNVGEVLDNANWGPGVSNTIKGAWTSGVNKFQCETGITRDLYSLVAHSWSEKIAPPGLPEMIVSEIPLMSTYPRWYEHLFNNGFPTFERGNVIITVPKDAKADRVICVEPGFNIWFQLGIGKVIQKRLKVRGVDLRDQKVNQWRAKHAVKHGLATVDFSSASDSISLELVREVLPPDWFEWMDACRSHYGYRADSWRRWEKFSSMGNGFTFPLESLIFYSAAVAVAEYVGEQPTWINAYGDDVIIPVSCFDLYSKFCDFLGFVVNHEKSYSHGQFRESCGSHYFGDLDVKPIFLKETINTPLSVYKLANAIRVYAHRSMGNYGCDAKQRRAFVQLQRAVHRSIRFTVPLGSSPEDRFSDGGFISSFDEATPSRARDGIEGYYTVHAAVSPSQGSSDGVGMLLFRLRNVGGGWSEKFTLADAKEHTVTRTWSSGIPSQTSKSKGNKFPLRGRTRIRVKRVLVHQWYDLGPWF